MDRCVSNWVFAGMRPSKTAYQLLNGPTAAIVYFMDLSAVIGPQAIQRFVCSYLTRHGLGTVMSLEHTWRPDPTRPNLTRPGAIRPAWVAAPVSRLLCQLTIVPGYQTVNRVASVWIAINQLLNIELKYWTVIKHQFIATFIAQNRTRANFFSLKSYRIFPKAWGCIRMLVRLMLYKSEI